VVKFTDSAISWTAMQCEPHILANC